MTELTPRQRTVLFLLCNRGELSARGVEDQYLGIYSDTARSIFYSLAKKGLVDVAGFESSRRGREQRTYKLTDRGYQLAVTLSDPDEDDYNQQPKGVPLMHTNDADRALDAVAALDNLVALVGWATAYDRVLAVLALTQPDALIDATLAVELTLL